jgi:hypothetical protein
MPSDPSRLDDLAGSFNEQEANLIYPTATVASTLFPGDTLGVRRLAVGEAVPFLVVEDVGWSVHACQYVGAG